MSTDEEIIEALKEDVKSSYGENRLDAVDTLATFGEDALPALVELLDFCTTSESQQHIREHIRDIKGNGKTEVTPDSVDLSGTSRS